MSGHTPGPWLDDGDGDIIRANAGNNRPDLMVIAEIQQVWTSAERKANARLIAAAPRMFQALQTLALHAQSLDAKGIQDMCDEALEGLS